MKRLWPLVLLAMTAPGLAGCAPSGEREPKVATRAAVTMGTHATTSDPSRLLVATPPTPATDCTQAISRGPATDTCKSSDARWVGTPLVTTANTVHCHFRWTAPAPAILATLKGANRIFEPDCPVVGLQGEAPPVETELWTNLHRAFERRSGATPFSPPPPSSPRRSHVVVAVVDSAAWPYATSSNDDTFGHGRLMGRVIADLACPLDPYLVHQPTSCPLSLRNFMAVPSLPPAEPGLAESVDWVNGGYFGTRGELAEALRDALASYETENQTRRHLIINLSLGWEGVMASDLISALADESIRILLERASCLGAITIAANGNRNVGTESGPFFPAAWQATAGPTANDCRRLRPSLTPDASANTVRPLVYAVAAVDGRDRPLLNARPTLPRLVAPGLSVVTEDQRGPGHTLVLSGSSLAAAVVSGIAAAVWESAGHLTGPDVMNRIYEAGVPLSPSVVPGGGVTQLCLGGTPCSDEQRRVSLCRALDTVGVPHGACGTPAAGNGALPHLTPPLVETSVEADAPDAGVSDPGDPAMPDASAAPPSGPAPPCEGPACGAWTPPYEKTPAVWTQPNGPACPSCVLFPCCGWVFGQVSPDMSIAKSATHTTAWLFSDYAPWGVPYNIDPKAMFWLPSPGGDRASIAFQFEGDWPGTGMVFSHLQDIAVVAP